MRLSLHIPLILTTLLVPGKIHAEELPVLTSVSQIRFLSEKEAARGYPVRLTAVITCKRTGECWGFIQDSSAAVGCLWSSLGISEKAHPGQEVALEGTTSAGDYIPIVMADRMTVLRDAAIPEAKPARLEDLMTGLTDCQRVEVRGIVRFVRPSGPDCFELGLATGGGKLQVFVSDPEPGKPELWVNGMVRVTGICAGFFSKNRQLYAIHLNSSHTSDIVFEESPPHDPYAAKSRSIRSIMQFAPDSPPNRMTKVSGTVVYHMSNGSFYLEDETGGVEIQSIQKDHLAIGDLVEVLGFPAWGEYTPRLEDAVFRRVGNGQIPRPTQVTAEQLLVCEHDARLVRLEGALVDQSRAGDQHIFVIKSGTELFNASIPSTDAPKPALTNGSLLSLTGICRIHLGERKSSKDIRASSFELFLRRPADIQVLREASWWTLRRLLALLAGVSILLGGAMGWVSMLRYRVRRQTAIISERLQAEASLKERSRIARELHDTVEQDLAAVAMHLNVVTDHASKLPVDVRESLHAAFHQIRRSQGNAHDAVWDLRSTTLTENGLAAALGEFVNLAADRMDGVAEFILRGKERRLPSVTEHHLLRLCGEAINNALRHASPQHLTVSLEYNDQAVFLLIQDDGCGFNPDALNPGSDHFGILGMRERASKIGARLTLQSAAGSGSLVKVELPYDSLPFPDEP